MGRKEETRKSNPLLTPHHRRYDTAAQKDVAVKVIDLEDVDEEIDQIQQEIGILKACRSPNITEFYGAALIPETSRLYIAMELMAAALGDMINESLKGHPLPEKHIAYVLREVLNALVYLHADHRIHRDIKAANILVSSHGDVKVSDFGVSAQLSNAVSKRKTFVGSPLWMAPEVISQTLPLSSPSSSQLGSSRNHDDHGQQETEEGYDESADIWSLGITAIELAQGEPPRSYLPNIQALFTIVKEDPPTLSHNEQWSAEFIDFIHQCLRKDPSARASAIDLLMHPFVINAEKPDEMASSIAAFLLHRPNVGFQSQFGHTTGTVKQKIPPPAPLQIPGEEVFHCVPPPSSQTAPTATLGDFLLMKKTTDKGAKTDPDDLGALGNFLLMRWRGSIVQTQETLYK